MSVTKSKKYFGERPLEGPVPFGSRYNSPKKEEVVTRNHNRGNNRYISYPSPEELAEYDRICEGSAAHIIALLDKEQIHRQNLYIKKHNSRTFSERVKISLGALCILGNTAAVVYLATKGHQIPSAIIAVALLFSVKMFYANKVVEKKTNVANHRFRNHNQKN